MGGLIANVDSRLMTITEPRLNNTILGASPQGVFLVNALFVSAKTGNAFMFGSFENGNVFAMMP